MNSPEDQQQQMFVPDDEFGLIVLLGDHGAFDVRPGDDPESQALAAAVRRANRHWQPGLKVRIPDRTSTPHRRPVAAATRPREGRGSRRQRSSSRGDPDPPEPSASPFAAAHRALLSLTAGELDVLADVADRRSALLRAGWAA